MNPSALYKIGYGMYLIGAHKGSQRNAQVANTVFQISSEPPTVAVSINKKNLTHEYIKDSRAFTASVLTQAAPLSFIGGFGFRSGRDADKLQGINTKTGQTGAPVVLDYAAAYLEAEVVQEVDAGTHTIFIGKVVAAEVLNDEPTMTYEYYHQVKRGTTPKTAPSYVEVKAESKGGSEKMAKYQCNICSYIYNPAKGDPEANIPPGTPFEKLPDDWRCPICGADKSEFKKLED
jgi:flavin reductase (DIM6/NTAB) family NADH-FMN oxidoreductase RutF/rubredoxin